MKETMTDSMPVPGIEAVASVGANSPNDKARTAVGSTDPYRFCVKAPHVPTSDSMKGGD